MNLVQFKNLALIFNTVGLNTTKNEQASQELLQKYLLDRDWKAVSTLLASEDYQADSNFAFEDAEFGTITPLELLIIFNQPDLIELLLPKTTKVILRNQKKLSLQYLIKKHGVQLRDIYKITSKLEIEIPGRRQYYTPLYGSDLAKAIIEGCTEIVKESMESLRTHREMGNFARTYLQLAAISGHYGICKILLGNQLVVDYIGELDRLGTGSAFDIAVRLGHANIVDLLLEQIVVFDTINCAAIGTSLPYLALAVTLLHVDVVQVLLKHGADVNIDGPQTLMQIALSKESWLRAQYFASTFDVERIVVLLSQAGAPVDGLTDEQRKLLAQILRNQKEETLGPSQNSPPTTEEYHLDIILEHSDIMNIVLDKLYLREFAIFSRTSKKIHRAAERYHIWKTPLRFQFKQSNRRSIDRFTPQTLWTRAQHLTIVPAGEQDNIDFVPVFRQLRYLDTQSASTFPPELFQEILRQCTHLHTLKMSIMPLALTDTTISATNLTSLSARIIEDTSATDVNVFKTLPNLQRFKSGFSAGAEIFLKLIENLQQNCSSLKKLHVGTYGNCSALRTGNHFKSFSNLESLVLELDSNSLDVMARHCSNLTKLTISGDVTSAYLNSSDNAVLQLTRLTSISLEQQVDPVTNDEFFAKLLGKSTKIKKLKSMHHCSSNIFELLSQYKGDITNLKYCATSVPDNLASKLPLRAFAGLKKLEFFTISPQLFYTILDTCPQLGEVFVGYEVFDDNGEQNRIDFGQIFSRGKNLQKLYIRGAFHPSNFGEIVTNPAIAPNLTWLEIEFDGTQLSLMGDGLVLYLAQCCPMLKQLKLPYGLIFSQCVSVFWRRYFLHLEAIECSSWTEIEPWIRSERTTGVSTRYTYV